MKRFSIPEDKVGGLFATLMNVFGREILDYLLPGEWSSGDSKNVLNYKMDPKLEEFWDKLPQELLDFFEALPQVPRPSSFLTMEDEEVHELPEPKEDPSGHDAPSRSAKSTDPDPVNPDAVKAKSPATPVGTLRSDGAMWDGTKWRPDSLDNSLDKPYALPSKNESGVGTVPLQTDRPGMARSKRDQGAMPADEAWV